MATFVDLCADSPNGFDVECFFTILDFYPLYLTFIIWTASFVTGSVWVFSLSFGITIDQLINLGLRKAIHQDGLQHIADQMPARSSQLAVYFICMLIYFSLIYNVRPSTYNISYVAFAEVLVVYARLYLEFNTTSQIVVGGVVGIIDASVQSLLIYIFIYRNIEYLESTRIYNWLKLTSHYMHALDDYDGNYQVNTKLNEMMIVAGFTNREQLRAFVMANIPEPVKAIN